MNLLLDTHTLIWVLADEPHLAPRARAAIGDGSTTVFVSAASAWEIASKRALGKLKAPGDLVEALGVYRFTPLAVTIEHALAVEGLPPLHADPFDRILIAQARLERLTIVTRDRRIAGYDVPVMPA